MKFGGGADIFDRQKEGCTEDILVSGDETNTYRLDRHAAGAIVLLLRW